MLTLREDGLAQGAGRRHLDRGDPARRRLTAACPTWAGRSRPGGSRADAGEQAPGGPATRRDARGRAATRPARRATSGPRCQRGRRPSPAPLAARRGGPAARRSRPARPAGRPAARRPGRRGALRPGAAPGRGRPGRPPPRPGVAERAAAPRTRSTTAASSSTCSSRCSTSGCSDLHLTAGARPTVRRHGHLAPLEDYPVARPADRPADALRGAHPEAARDVRGGARARLRLQPARARPASASTSTASATAIGAAFRLIPYEIKRLEDLGVPPAVSASPSCRAASCSSPGPPARASRRRSPPWSTWRTARATTTS